MVDEIDFSCPFGFSSENFPPKPAKKLGDRVAAIAKPVARAIDNIAGTDLENCGGCEQMRRDLNAGMGIASSIRKRLNQRNS